jgi:hypothetical protein
MFKFIELGFFPNYISDNLICFFIRKIFSQNDLYNGRGKISLRRALRLQWMQPH